MAKKLVRASRKKSSSSFFIPMHDIAYGRTIRLLTTGGCIADVSSGAMSQVTAHTHDAIAPRRPARLGINLINLSTLSRVLPLRPGAEVGCGHVQEKTSRRVRKVRDSETKGSGQ